MTHTPAQTPAHDSASIPQLALGRQHTALLVIDPVNDFLSEGGAAWDLTKTTVESHNVVENMRRAIEGARNANIPVLFAPMAFTREDYAEAALHKRSGIHRIMFERKMFLAGSWGADFHPELRPLEQEIVLQPHKGTDVYESNLPEHLQRLAVQHVVIIGMTANLCCEGTGRRLVEAGYTVTFLSDAIGSENLPSYEAAVRLNFPLIANAVMTTAEFLAALADDSGSVDDIRTGDTVRGSDHLEIGTVETVVAATEETEAHLKLTRGLVFKSNLYVPLDAVVRRVGSEVFVNVPRTLVDKLGWDQPPARQQQLEKLGPPLADVAMLYRSRSPSRPQI